MNSLTHRVEQIAMAPMAKRPPWRLLTACLVFLATLLLMPGAWGQDNATINGTVMDPTGAVIPNAAISLTNPATGQVRQDTSNSAGAYRFANLGVGTYTLSASVTGSVAGAGPRISAPANCSPAWRAPARRRH